MRVRPRILHVITGLDVGGAEWSLFRLVAALGSRFEHRVVNLSAAGALEERFRSEGVPVHRCSLKARPLSGFRELVMAISADRPDLVHAWMYHANLAAGLARWLARSPVPLIWSVRHSLDAFTEETWAVRQLIRLGGSGIFRPDVVTYNSYSGRDSHLSYGFGRHASEVITNGVDVERFQRRNDRRLDFRRALGCPDDAPLVGYLGRFHTLKDIPTLVACFAAIRRRLPQARFVMIGQDLAPENPTLQALIRDADLGAAVRCLGRLVDVADVYPGLDLLVLASRAESSPNVLLEAMACEVPCVATATGDCARILGEEKRIAPVGDPLALAECAITALGGGAQLGVAARRRVMEQHTRHAEAAAYTNLYQHLLASESAP